jgi:hypothetical protein
VSEEINIVAVFLRYGLDFGISSSKNMLSPLLIVKSSKFDPSLKILILTFYDALLPLLVSSNVVILIETIMPMMFSLLEA